MIANCHPAAVRMARCLLALIAATAGLLEHRAARAATFSATPEGAQLAQGDLYVPPIELGIVGDGRTETWSVTYQSSDARLRIVGAEGLGGASCSIISRPASPDSIAIVRQLASGPAATAFAPLCRVSMAFVEAPPAGDYRLTAISRKCFSSTGLPDQCIATDALIQVGSSGTATPLVRYTPAPGTRLATVVVEDGQLLGRIARIDVDIAGGVSGSMTIDRCSGAGIVRVDGNPAITVQAGDPPGDVDLTIEGLCGGIGAPTRSAITCAESSSAGTSSSRRWTVDLCGVAFVAEPSIISQVAAVDVTASSVRLTAQVTAPAGTGTATFDVGVAAANAYAISQANDITGSQAAATVSSAFSGLACGTEYRYRLRVNVAGGETRSLPDTFSTSPCPSGELGASLDVLGAQRVGVPVTFRASTSSTGPLTYRFDLDGDGVTDSIQQGGSATVTYPYAYAGNVAVVVEDQAGVRNTASRSVSIEAPRMVVRPAGSPIQACGDSDSFPEPGERWRIPLLVENAGGVAARDARVALVARDRLAAIASGVPEPGLLLVEDAGASLGELQPGASTPLALGVQLSAAAACNARYGVVHFGSSDAVSYSSGSETDVAVLVTPPAGQCQVISGCAPASATALRPIRQGLYFDPDRSGNGMGSFVVQRPGQLPLFFGAWFTGRADRSPTWYIVQGPVVGNQVVAPLLAFRRDLAAATFRATSSVAGTAVVDLVDAGKLVLSHALDGRFGAEQMVFLTSGPMPSPNRSGAWFNTGEGGWGQVVHQFVDTGSAQHGTAVVHFLYDALGDPSWVLAQGTTAALAASSEHRAFRIHCAGCPWTAGTSTGAGAGSIQFNGASVGTVSTEFQIPAELGGGTWRRNALPITILTDPQ